MFKINLQVSIYVPFPLPFLERNFALHLHLSKLECFFITNLKININRLPTFLATLVLIVEVQKFIGRNTTVCNAFSFCFYHPDYHVWHAVLRLKNQQTQVNKKIPLKGNNNTFFYFLI